MSCAGRPAAPAFLGDLIEVLPAAGPRFPGLRLVRIAGASLPARVLEGGLARVSPHLAVVYGLMEIGFVSMARADVLRRAPGSAGPLVEGVEVQVVDERDAPLPPGATGLLRMRRAGLAAGYLNNPAASAKAFRDGWFYPGDAGRLDNEGLLHLQGRLDDKLNLRGVKIEPAPIEQALHGHPAVVEAAVFAAAPQGYEPALFAAVVLRSPVDEKLLLAHCREQVGPAYTPKRIFFTDRLPRNEAGKLLRNELARRVLRRPAAAP